MPFVFRIGPYRLSFWSRENNEPPHVHVKRDRDEAKFWLSPVVELAANHHFADHELNDITRIVIENRDELLRAWNEHFDTDQNDA